MEAPRQERGGILEWCAVIQMDFLSVGKFCLTICHKAKEEKKRRILKREKRIKNKIWMKKAEGKKRVDCSAPSEKAVRGILFFLPFASFLFFYSFLFGLGSYDAPFFSSHAPVLFLFLYHDHVASSFFLFVIATSEKHTKNGKQFLSQIATPRNKKKVISLPTPVSTN